MCDMSEVKAIKCFRRAGVVKAAESSSPIKTENWSMELPIWRLAFIEGNSMEWWLPKYDKYKFKRHCGEEL